MSFESQKACAESTRVVVDGLWPETHPLCRSLGSYRQNLHPALEKSLSMHLSDSLPTDALIDLEVRRSIRRFILIWWLQPYIFAARRIPPLPQQRPACICDALPMTAGPRTAVTRTITRSETEQPLRGDKHEPSCQRPPAAIAAQETLPPGSE